MAGYMAYRWVDESEGMNGRCTEEGTKPLIWEDIKPIKNDVPRPQETDIRTTIC